MQGRHDVRPPGAIPMRITLGSAFCSRESSRGCCGTASANTGQSTAATTEAAESSRTSRSNARILCCGVIQREE